MYSLLAGTQAAVARARMKAPADKLGEDINEVFGEKSKKKRKTVKRKQKKKITT